jgi:hydrogenase maturation protein HypF
VEVEGAREQVRRFERRLETERPPAAIVLAREISRLAPVGYRGFEIRSSDSARPKAAVVLPDLATCIECRDELFDPTNRLSVVKTSSSLQIKS